MQITADDIALALIVAADRAGDPTPEQLAPILARLSRRERAVVAGFFERLADQERRVTAQRA